jgi:hypothetical protein
MRGLKMTDWKIAAIYRAASRGRLVKPDVSRLLSERGRLSRRDAEQLATIWYAGPLRHLPNG